MPVRRVSVWSIGSVLLIVFAVCVKTSTSATTHDRRRGTRHIQLEIINSTSVTLRWTPPSSLTSEAGEPCPVHKYLIRLKQHGVRKSRAWKLEPDRLSVSLHDLRPDTEYKVRLTTFICAGVRRHSRWTHILTSDPRHYEHQELGRRHQSRATSLQSIEHGRRQETQAPGQPTAVRTMTSSDSAVVSWLPPEDNTLVRTYMIGYGEGVPDVKWIYVNGSHRNVTIHQLKPSTQYVVSVRAINRFGKGLVVYDLVYTRDAPVRQTGSETLPAPVDLRTRTLSAHSVRLHWVDPSLDHTQRIVDERYYNVYYHAAPHGKNLSVIVKALHVTLHDLEPGRRYRFKVRTVKGVNTSPFSDTATHRTPPNNDLSEGGDNSTSSRQSRRQLDDILNGDVSEETERPSEQGKTKRAHDDDLGDHNPPLGAQAQLGHDHRDAPNSTLPVAFRALVQHRVSAYVTWPAHLDCDVTSASGVAGYIFRYRAVDGAEGHADGGENPSYVVRNLAVNFVLIDNLVPGIQYRYQVRYVPERGDASAWSQEGELDTTPPLQRHMANP